MKKILKTIAVTVAAAALFSLASCTSTSWSVKYSLSGECGVTAADAERYRAANTVSGSDLSPTDISDEEITLPGGLYSAFLLRTFTVLMNSGELNSNLPVSAQTVGEKSASQYIDEEADKLLKQFIVMSRRLACLGFTFDRTEASNYSTVVEEYTKNTAKYEKWGVGLESMLIAFVDYSIMDDALFEATHGEKGYAPISDEEILSDYFTAGYVRQYFMDTNYYPLSDEEIAYAMGDIQATFDQLTAGTLDFAAVVEDYNSYAMLMRQGQEETYIKISDMDENMKLVYESEVGAYTLVKGETPEGVGYMAIYRRLALDPAAPDSSFPGARDDLLFSYQHQAFLDELAAFADTLTDVVYNPAVFDTFTTAKLGIGD